MVVAMVAVFLLPSTIAIYQAVNGTAWNLQDLGTFASQLLAPAVAVFTSASVVRLAILLMPDVTHPVTHVRLFELDCALIR
jgi:hypothetical protein